MNLSIQDEFYLFAKELQRYLSPHILQQLAQETGFVKRKSKYGARDLAPIYPSSGGCAQTAGIKIQLEYDLHSGKFLNFQMEPGENNDKTF
ncbi:IS4 family transposase, partial [Bacillus pseudomycoides]